MNPPERLAHLDYDGYFERMARNDRSPPRDINLSASKWTLGHIYLLRVAVSNVKLTGNEMLASLQDREAFRKAREHMDANTLLETVLSALKGSQHHLPNTHIMILLEEKGVPQAFSFFASIRDQLEPMVHYSPSAHDIDENTFDSSKNEPSYTFTLLPPTEDPIRVTRGAAKRANDERARVLEELELERERQERERERERQEREREQERPEWRSVGETIANEADDLDFPEDIDFEGPSITSVISNDEETEKEREKDELVTTKMVDVFITLIFTLFYRFNNDTSVRLKNGKLMKIKSNSRQSYRHFSLNQKMYKVQTAFGDFKSKTDGGVYEARWEEGKCRRPDDPDAVPNIVDMEAKAAGISQPLPQHVAELIAHIYTRLRLLYQSNDPKLQKFESYSILNAAQRTAYLFCFHQTNFRVVWATFTPEYLAFLFGPPAQAFLKRDSTSTQNQSTSSKENEPVLELFVSEEMPMIYAASRRKVALAIIALGLFNQNYGEIARS